MYKFTKNGRDYRLLKEQAILEYKNGLKCKQISIKLKICRDTVAKWLTQEGFVYSKVNKADIDPNIFESIDSEQKAYWLGFIFADGYVSKKSNFELSLALKDINHLEKFKKFLSYKGKIYIDNKIGRCRLQFQDSKIVNDLKKIGCHNKKSLILEFPNIDKSFYNHFIRGYFDGDGYIRKCTSPILIEIIGTYAFLSKIHEITNISITKIKSRDKREPHIVFTNSISGNTAREFCNYMYYNSTIFLERKHNRYLEQLENINSWNNGKKYKKYKTTRI